MVCVPLVLLLQTHVARAWSIGSQLNEQGCHEPITAAALRAVRAKFDTAPVLMPSRDEAAMIADVLFLPPNDFVHDLAGMTLLVGVRDNDLKGINPLSSLSLIQVHGSPTTQQEHCIRSSADDGDAGNLAALAACRAYIVDTATGALDGLDSNGRVDPTIREPFTLYVGMRKSITPSLPLFYLRISAAMHALEDGFPHTYRTTDGMRVTVVLNWIDLINGTYDEARDGPSHHAEMDRCWDDDPTIQRDYDVSIQAATELLSAALDPSLGREDKLEQFEKITEKYLTFEPGCSLDNAWCDSDEASVTNSVTGCNASGDGALVLWIALASLGVVIGRRRRNPAIGTALVFVAAMTTPTRAEDTGGSPVPASEAASAQPAVPIPAPDANPKDSNEPGREQESMTVGEAASVREDKRLGNRWGITGSVGGAVHRSAFVTSLGVRYRITEKWIVGLDGAWNPWVTTSPMNVRGGVVTMAAVVTRRFPMRFDRVNLRSTLYLGSSTLLFDVYGAPKYSTGPYGAISPLGIDYDLGHSVRIIWDPMEIALPIPLVGQLPLYYEQFRFMVGLQIGG
jgi:uncharacterized protein (TIGR03382 family)